MKQTAVEWFMDKLDDELELYNSQWLIIEKYFNQAKEMEKQQIIDTYITGSISLTSKIDAEQYYNETFNK